MRFVIAGSSGFLGTALRQSLKADGHEIIRLVRRPATAADESRWDPYAGRLDQAVIDKAEVVVNLAAASLLGNPHTRGYAERQRDSRVLSTMVLAEAVARAAGGPTLMIGTGISIYGDHGDELVREDTDSRGDGLLTRVCRDVQQAAALAETSDARVCLLRSAPIVDRANLLLKLTLPTFRLGMGARLGSGRQYFPVISLRDWVAAATHLAVSDAPAGPYNMCCPVTPTNAEYTEALAAAVGPRARLAAPAKLIELAGGPMGTEALTSVRGEPAALERSGYEFRDHDVRDVVASALRP